MIGSTSCSKGLHKQIASNLQVNLQWNFHCLSCNLYQNIIWNFGEFWFYVVSSLETRTCYRTESAGRTNDCQCFAIMGLQFKNCRRAAGLPPALPLLRQSQNGCCPQLQWTDAFSSNKTAPRHYSWLRGCYPTEKMHCSSWPRSRTNPWTELIILNTYETLGPLAMVMWYGPKDRIIPEGNVLRIRGKIRVSSLVELPRQWPEVSDFVARFCTLC